MKYIKPVLLYGGLGASVILLVHTLLLTPCSSIIEYDIGEFDERYRITQEEFLATILEAEIPWEDAAGKSLFVYTPGAEFTINLLWSENQQRVYDGDDLEKNLDSKEELINGTQQRYQTAVRRYESAKQTFQKNEASFQRDLSRWNSNPGTEQEYTALKKKETALKRELKKLNELGKEVNIYAQESNQYIDEYNQNVNQYNELFDGKEFDAGTTDGKRINVYSFDGREELYTLLVHEFGHVLGIDHVDDSGAIMYYLLNEENKNGTLTERDITALMESCRL